MKCAHVLGDVGVAGGARVDIYLRPCREYFDGGYEAGLKVEQCSAMKGPLSGMARRACTA